MLPQTWPKIVSRSHLTCTDVNWRNNILFWADVTQREQPHWAEIRSCTFNSSANNQLCDSIMFKRAYGWTAEMVTCITHTSQTLSLSIYLQLHYFTWCASICYDGIRKLQTFQGRLSRLQGWIFESGQFVSRGNPFTLHTISCFLIFNYFLPECFMPGMRLSM